MVTSGYTSYEATIVTFAIAADTGHIILIKR